MATGDVRRWQVPVYTVEQAQILLTEIGPLVAGGAERLLRLGAPWIQDPVGYRRIEAAVHLPRADLSRTVSLAEVSGSLLAVVRLHDELNRLGVVLRDPARGLLDIFHVRAGRLVYLCYHLGETRLGYWHELDAGFAGRQPL